MSDIPKAPSGYLPDWSMSVRAARAEEFGYRTLYDAIDILVRELSISDYDAKRMLDEAGPSQAHHVGGGMFLTAFYDVPKIIRIARDGPDPVRVWEHDDKIPNVKDYEDAELAILKSTSEYRGLSKTKQRKLRAAAHDRARDRYSVALNEFYQKRLDWLEENPTYSRSQSKFSEADALADNPSDANRGYVGYSKSVRAVGAEERGLFPLTVAAKILSKILGVTQKVARGFLDDVGPSEWHHTSKKFNKTNYYSVDIGIGRGIADVYVRRLPADWRYSVKWSTSGVTEERLKNMNTAFDAYSAGVGISREILHALYYRSWLDFVPISMRYYPDAYDDDVAPLRLNPGPDGEALILPYGFEIFDDLSAHDNPGLRPSRVPDRARQKSLFEFASAPAPAPAPASAPAPAPAPASVSMPAPAPAPASVSMPAPAPASALSVARLRKIASGFEKKIAKFSGTYLENTPKRQLQGMVRRVQEDQLRSALNATLILADAVNSGGDSVRFAKLSAAEISKYTERQTEHPSYYTLFITNKYQSMTPDAVAFRAFIDSRGTLLSEEDSNRRALQRAIAAIKFSPIPGFFPTPPALVARVIDLADISPGMSVLEPSAGLGDLVNAARAVGANVAAVEINHELYEILKLQGINVGHVDFLGIKSTEFYDRVIMNPPFERLQDIQHIRKSYDWLVPGGRLVAVISPSFTFHRGAQWFRDWIETVPHEIYDVDRGSFRGVDVFRETGIDVKIIVIDKPSLSNPPLYATYPKSKFRAESIALAYAEADYPGKALHPSHTKTSWRWRVGLKSLAIPGMEEPPAQIQKSLLGNPALATLGILWNPATVFRDMPELRGRTKNALVLKSNEEAAEDRFELFHGFDPSRSSSIEVRAAIPESLEVVGTIKSIEYASDKWDHTRRGYKHATGDRWDDDRNRHYVDQPAEMPLLCIPATKKTPSDRLLRLPEKFRAMPDEFVLLGDLLGVRIDGQHQPFAKISKRRLMCDSSGRRLFTDGDLFFIFGAFSVTSHGIEG